MDYKQAREYIDDISGYGSVLGLSNIKELLRRMGNPERKLKIIHVAGSNGKGSVVSYLSTVYTTAGYQVGRYISPTICKYRERIQINNRYITKEDFAKGITCISQVAEEMADQGFAHPTPFEVETALCLWYFCEKNCDLVILECGLGGREDATNAIEEKLCTVFTSISMDHMGILGDSLEQIAENKAGIMRKNTPAISIEQAKEVEEVLEKCAKENHCTLQFVSSNQAKVSVSNLEEQIFSFRDETMNFENVRISLVGEHQIKNALLALKVITHLQDKGFFVEQEKIFEGMERTRWLGRLTKVHDSPRIIVDGAHNEDAAKQLAKVIDKHLKNCNLVYLLGIFKDKDYGKILEHTAKYAAQIITFTIPENPRAMDGYELAKVVREYNDRVTNADSLQEALEMAVLLAGDEGTILSFGSLSFIGRLMEEIERYDKKTLIDGR